MAQNEAGHPGEVACSTWRRGGNALEGRKTLHQNFALRNWKTQKTQQKEQLSCMSSSQMQQNKGFLALALSCGGLTLLRMFEVENHKAAKGDAWRPR
jgi:hypothetical protein